MIDTNTLMSLLPHLSSDEKKECLQEIARLELSPNTADEVYQIVKIFGAHLEPQLQKHIQTICNKLESRYPGQFSFDFITSRQVIDEHFSEKTDTPQSSWKISTSSDIQKLHKTQPVNISACKICEKCGCQNNSTMFCTSCKSLQINTTWKQPTFAQRALAFWLDILLLISGPVLGYSFIPEAGLLLLAVNLFTQFSLFSAGTTLGKQIVGLQIVDANNGKPAGLAQVFFRETIGKAISLLCLGLGFVWGGLDRNGRTWHDHLSGSVVVSIEENIYDI